MAVDVYVTEESKQARRGRRRIVAFVIAGIFLLCALAALWMLLYSPFFTLQRIEVYGNERLSRTEVISAIEAGMLRGSFLKQLLGFGNILTWPTTVSGETLRLLPRAGRLSIEKLLAGRTVIIQIEERKPAAIWCAAEPYLQCAWFDKEGVLFERSLAAEGSLIPVVRDVSREYLGLGARVLREEQISNLFSIFAALRAAELNIKEIQIEDIGLEEVRVLTYDGPELLFSLRHPAEGALAVIASLREKMNFSNLEYIDFRVENRAYYK